LIKQYGYGLLYQRLRQKLIKIIFIFLKIGIF